MKTNKLQTSNFSVFRIPRPKIPDSKSKMFIISGLFDTSKITRIPESGYSYVGLNYRSDIPGEWY